uniref:Large S protein n=1 Tax=Hepatitis B virus TaxID=10407 RepID=D2X4K1_HBV|nr:large S protein [Hepatitis B virus]ADB55540.1 large S protein [Hepatitis B virus]
MGGWSSKPRQGMGTNLSVPNPMGFFPDHQLDPALGANSNNPDWDFNPNKDHWPEANQVGAGAFGPGFTPPHGGLLGWSPQAQGILTTVPVAPPPASTNRQSGRQPTPISPPLATVRKGPIRGKREITRRAPFFYNSVEGWHCI